MSEHTPTHAQRRLLSNKSSFSSQGGQGPQGPQGVSTSSAAHVSSSLNSQIYASRAHSLQQLQMREQYAAAVAAASSMGYHGAYYMQGIDTSVQQQQQMQQMQQMQQQMPQQQYAYSYNYSYSYQGMPLAPRPVNTMLRGNGGSMRPSTPKGRSGPQHQGNAGAKKHGNHQNLPEVADAAAAQVAVAQQQRTVPYASVAFRAGRSCDEYSAALQHRAIVNLVPKRGPRQGRQHSRNVYRLREPLGRGSAPQSRASLLVQGVEAGRGVSAARQPMLLGGNPSCKATSLAEFTPRMFEEFFGGKVQEPSTPAKQQKQPRQLQLKTSANVSQLYNDSFDLSFDGKAMDRSDVFRMVDSFSVAFSDNDNDNGNDTSMMQNTQSVIIQESPEPEEKLGRLRRDAASPGPSAEDSMTPGLNADESMAPGSSSSIMVAPGAEGDEPSFIVGPTDTILPAEITSGNPSY